MGRRPKGKPPVRHKIEGTWPRERNICGADMRGFPEKWVATEEWRRAIKEKEIKRTRVERKAKHEIYLKDYSIKPNRYS